MQTKTKNCKDIESFLSRVDERGIPVGDKVGGEDQLNIKNMIGAHQMLLHVEQHPRRREVPRPRHDLELPATGRDTTTSNSWTGVRRLTKSFPIVAFLNCCSWSGGPDNLRR